MNFYGPWNRKKRIVPAFSISGLLRVVYIMYWAEIKISYISIKRYDDDPTEIHKSIFIPDASYRR